MAREAWTFTIRMAVGSKRTSSAHELHGLCRPDVAVLSCSCFGPEERDFRRRAAFLDSNGSSLPPKRIMTFRISRALGLFSRNPIARDMLSLGPRDSKRERTTN